MKLALIVNRVETEIAEYATNRFARAAARAGHDVWYAGLGDIDYTENGRLKARAQRVSYEGDDSLETILETARSESNREYIELDRLDAVMLRNDSIEDLHDRPWAAGLGVIFGRMLVGRGVVVVNDPIGLPRASSKLYLEEFPAEIRPRSLVSREPDAIRGFIGTVGAAVVKPLHGAKGRNVFVARADEDENLNQMIEAVLEDGYILAQEYLEDAKDGDTRLFLLEGDPLQVDGSYAAFRRIPPEQDLRSNISTGGRSKPASIGENELAIAAAMKDRLIEDGMFFVGIDIVGDKVVEINAESAGGLQSSERFTGIDFAPTVIDAIEQRLRR